MIDGFKSLHPYLDASVWLDNPALSNGFALSVIEQTGEILRKRRDSNYKGLRFELWPSTTSNQWCCGLAGSLHSYYNEGEHNANSFPYSGLCKVIENLSQSFGIQANKAKLQGLEIGLNIRLPFSPLRITKSAIMYGRSPYEALGEQRRKGSICVQSQYAVKLYDKGYLSGLFSTNILRIEVKVNKMQFLQSHEIHNLADLINYKKLSGLVSVLLDAVDKSIFIDRKLDDTFLSQRECLLLAKYRNPATWQEMGSRQLREYHRKALDMLLKKCNAFDLKAFLKTRILEEWTRDLGPEKTLGKVTENQPVFPVNEAEKNLTFLPFKCLCKNVKSLPLELSENQAPVLPFPVRVCKSCGKDISHQKGQSVFCSEKYNGSAARKCRNQDSNHRRGKRRKLNQAMKKNEWVRITYSHEGESYTDILHSSEIKVSREWLDQITAIEIIPESELNTVQNAVQLTGNEAKNAIRAYSKENPFEEAKILNKNADNQAVTPENPVLSPKKPCKRPKSTCKPGCSGEKCLIKEGKKGQKT